MDSTARKGTRDVSAISEEAGRGRQSGSDREPIDGRAVVGGGGSTLVRRGRPLSRPVAPEQASMEVALYRRHQKVFRIASCVVHAVGAVHFTFGCYYDWFQVNVPKEVSPIFAAFGYKFKFLTYWDALLQAAYFIVATVNDILGPKNKETSEPTKLCKVKDYIECSIAFPIAIFVGFTFWSLMAIDRELVLPKALDPYFPAWLNHVMHTNIVIFQILEVITSQREYPPRKWGLLGLSIFQGLYLTWMHIVYAVSGLWAYPIFSVLNIPSRILFMIGSFFTGYLFYFLGEYFNRCLWAAEKPRTHPNVKYNM